MLSYPSHQGQHERGNLDATFGQAVIHPRRNRRLGITLHKAVTFESLQCLREHLLADPLSPTAQVTPAVRPLGQSDQNQNAPFAGDMIQDSPARAAGRENAVDGGETGITAEGLTFIPVTYLKVRTLFWEVSRQVAGCRQ